MIREFTLPDLGEGLTESEIVSWKVSEGQAVTLNQVIAEVETAKAVVQLPSPWEGVIARLLHAEGTTVDVGTPILAMDVGGADDADALPRDNAAASADGGKREPTLVGYGAAPSTGARPARRRRSATVVPATVVPVAAGPEIESPDEPAEPDVPGVPLPGRPGEPAEPPVPNGPEVPPLPQTPDEPLSPDGPEVPPLPGGPEVPLPPAPSSPPASRFSAPSAARRPSTPIVRKLARDLRIDLARVPGTGRGGLVTRTDILAAHGTHTASTAPGDPTAAGDAAPTTAVQPTPAPTPAPTPEAAPSSTTASADGARVAREPIRGVRKHTAAAMVASAFTAPHVTEFLTVDVTESVALLDRLRADRSWADTRPTMTALVAKAVLVGLRRHRQLNSRWDEAAGEILRFGYVNLGIAAATDRGLIVPNIKDADAMDLRRLTTALAELTTTARAGRTAPADLAGGTFTISNVGVFGVDAGTPILNPGEAGILATGQVRRTPWEHRGEIALRCVMTLSLSFDHRLVDGEAGSRFLADIGAVLASPGATLTMV